MQVSSYGLEKLLYIQVHNILFMSKDYIYIFYGMVKDLWSFQGSCKVASDVLLRHCATDGKKTQASSVTQKKQHHWKKHLFLFFIYWPLILPPQKPHPNSTASWRSSLRMVMKRLARMSHLRFFILTLNSLSVHS